MTFDEVLSQVQALLQREQRVSYRGLKRRFDLDDEYLEDLKEEFIGAKRLAADEDGRFLVWVGESEERKAKSEERGKAELKELSAASRPTLHVQRSDGERRQLTVMFCDLVGSTALSTQLDPEELREVVRAYQQTSATVIERFGGHIAQYLGDGLLVYFGYPVAHEDDAARTVRAGLGIVEAIGSQGSEIRGQENRQHVNTRLLQPLRVRIGIHTGQVVVGEIGSSEKREMLALGETPNIAARIQGQANPDEVVISAATYRLVEGLFDCEDRGQPELKGTSTPLTLYRVVKEGEAQSRFQVVVRQGLTPLVGREHEYGLLRERWARVKEDEGQVVLLSGEPGIGKSRLVEALKETVEHEGARCLELRCSPYHQNSALYPVIEHLQRGLGFQSEDSPEEKLHSLENALGRRGGSQTRPYSVLSEAMPLFAALLSLPHPEGYPILALSPQKQKEKTYEALVTWLCEETKQQAVVYAWEDLHWADPSTLELLTLFLAQVPTTRLLVVLTFRPEFTPLWDSHSYLSQLTLSRLGRAHVETMVEKVTGGKALPPEIVRQIANKTDGVPLFVEELTKMVVESNLVAEVDGHYELNGPLPPLAIPSTLQDSLMARLDRLATVREIAQIGATIGRKFTYELLQAVSPLHEEALQHGLRQLIEAELVFQSGVPPQARYLFKHALVQETAYQSLLKSRRQQLHQQVAQVLVEQFVETVATQPELVAHHYTEAGLIAQALPYWQRAGQKAVQRSANAEAITHLTKGLELLQTLPDTPERTQQELTLQITLGPALMATKGLAAPKVEGVYARARELCQRVGETPQLFPVLSGLLNFYSVRGEHQTAYELAKQFFSLAQRVQDPVLLLEAHHLLGGPLYFLGELVSAQVHLKQCIALYDPEQHRSHAFLYGGHDPGVCCLSQEAHSLWLLGYPDQALKKSHDALRLAQELSHPFSLAQALVYAAVLHEFRGEVQATQRRAEEVIELSREQEFPIWLPLGTAMQGWTLAEQTQVEEGIIKLRQGLTAYRATGAEMGQPYRLALLAAAYGKAGQAEEGLTVLAEALDMVQRTGERVTEARLYRLYGELLLQLRGRANGRTGEKVSVAPLSPEECFLKAIEIARRQQAKSLELRATMSLTRLWQQQGKRHEAHQMLSEIYNWFTEGFDTKDQQEAKALLEELVAT